MDKNSKYYSEEEKMINELRKIMCDYVAIIGDLERDIEWLEEEVGSTDPEEYFHCSVECEYKYRQTVMKVHDPKKIWNHEKKVWEKIIDYREPKEEES